MNLLIEKTKEVTATLLPIVILVLVLVFTIVDVQEDVLIRFIVGSVLLLIGLGIFLWGVDLAMNPIGDYMSREIATSKSPLIIAILSFLLGFLITVAEPDLLVLGSQVEAASGGVLSSQLIVYVVSIGVGVMIAFGVFRLLLDKPLNVFMAITYGVIFLLTIFVSPEFMAISFDASGATTGALTTPFILALSLGLAKMKGGKNAQENSFGLVGIMSAGPILAVMLMSIITRQESIKGEASLPVVAEGVFGTIINAVPGIFLESLIALLPISILFFIYNGVKFKLNKTQIIEIAKGLVAILIGLTLFLTAVHSGFMDMGRIIGMELATMNDWLLIGVAFLIGFVVVLVEPAVHVLGEQIEEVTGGQVSFKVIRNTLSIGVGIAIALSMVRIVVPEVQLWYFLLLGFALAVLLSFFADPIFVGIAYDAGGVASGPMTATFVLAFAQGAAFVTESANVLVDGFGVIAMVAMTPVLSIMILGTLFRHEKTTEPKVEEKQVITPIEPEASALPDDCLVVIVNRGFSKMVVDVAREAGAKGATIIQGRSVDSYSDHDILTSLLHLERQEEKQMILFVTEHHVSSVVAERLLAHQQLNEEADIVVLGLPAEAMGETFMS